MDTNTYGTLIEGLIRIGGTAFLVMLLAWGWQLWGERQHSFAERLFFIAVHVLSGSAALNIWLL